MFSSVTLCLCFCPYRELTAAMSLKALQSVFFFVWVHFTKRRVSDCRDTSGSLDEAWMRTTTLYRARKVQSGWRPLIAQLVTWFLRRCKKILHIFWILFLSIRFFLICSNVVFFLCIRPNKEDIFIKLLHIFLFFIFYFSIQNHKCGHFMSVGRQSMKI